MNELRKRLGQVAAHKRLLNANGVAVILAHPLGPIPARKQKRDAPLPQHVRNRKTQPTRKVDVQNREVKRPITCQRQGLLKPGRNRRDLIAEVGPRSVRRSSTYIATMISSSTTSARFTSAPTLVISDIANTNRWQRRVDRAHNAALRIGKLNGPAEFRR